MTDQHLSEIPTLWTVVRHAHGDEPTARQRAQTELLDRYSNAIRRYLLASLRDADAADELMQEFSLRFVRGDFRNADPSKGRFRAFVKTSVFRLIMDHHRGGKKRNREGHLDYDAAAPEMSLSPDDDRLFLNSWRDDLLDRAWKTLAQLDEKTGGIAHAVLRAKVDNPQMRSEQLAEHVSQVIGRDLNAGALRVQVHRAREKFAESLLQSVVDSLENPDEEMLEAELIDLRLIDYCRPALEKRR